MRLARFRKAYGASPLHLLALLASLAFAGYAALALFQLDVKSVLVWFLVALIGHDLILLPLYTLLDRIAFGDDRRRAHAARARVPAGTFLKVPALLSGLLALVFAPEILALGTSYRSLTGRGEGVYLGRWLAVTGAMFALSGLAYAIALRRARRASVSGRLASLPVDACRRSGSSTRSTSASAGPALSQADAVAHATPTRGCRSTAPP
jgi:hypothetical protein